MKSEKEIWVDEVLKSMEGSQRAKPNPSLLSKLESELFAPKTKVIFFHNWKVASAAAALILLLNVLAFQQISKENSSSYNTFEEVSDLNYQLVSNYNIYE